MATIFMCCEGEKKKKTSSLRSNPGEEVVQAAATAHMKVAWEVSGMEQAEQVLRNQEDKN
uniref:Uncharacterized protein n=1 Tax=Oryza meridionalis TaxID=40149 RepID=A0A0E0BZ63_9ORYZ